MENINITKTAGETTREQLTPLEIRMAVTAIKQGVTALRERKTYATHDDENIRACKSGFVQAGSDSAAEVLFEMFEVCSADCKSAMEEMANDENVWIYGNKTPIFDRFVDELSAKKGMSVRVRKVEKVEIF